MKAVWLVCEGCGERWHLRRWYLQCFECGHVYRTRWHLLAMYRWERWRYSRIFPKEYNPLRLLFGPWWRPSRIGFCQCCIHDL